MQVDLEKIVREGGALEAVVPSGTLDGDADRAIEAGPGALKGRLTRMRNGFDLRASYSGWLMLECVRCLEPFRMDLGFDFRLLFVSAEAHAAPGSELKIQEEDCDLYTCRGGKIDLAAISREQVYLQIPLKPVCEDSCRGLCAVCGENLNRGPCRCGEAARVPVI